MATLVAHVLAPTDLATPPLLPAVTMVASAAVPLVRRAAVLVMNGWLAGRLKTGGSSPNTPQMM